MGLKSNTAKVIYEIELNNLISKKKKTWNPLSWWKNRKTTQDLPDTIPKLPDSKRYSRFQLYVLSYLFSEELEKNKLERVSFNKRIKKSIQQLTNITPSKFLPQEYEQISKEIWQMRTDLMVTDTADKFYLSSEGKFFVKKYLEPLVASIEDQERYYSIMEGMGINEDEKAYLKQFYKKLKDKSQDEIIAETFRVTKEYLPLALSFVFKSQGN